MYEIHTARGTKIGWFPTRAAALANIRKAPKYYGVGAKIVLVKKK